LSTEESLDAGPACVHEHLHPNRAAADGDLAALPDVEGRPRLDGVTAFLVWVLMGIALWHFAILVPDRFWGGIIGAFVAALVGGVAGGYLLPVPGWNTDNPPGVTEGLYAIPGALAGLVACWLYGARAEAREAAAGARPAATRPRAEDGTRGA
jgi:hypothetical protein